MRLVRMRGVFVRLARGFGGTAGSLALGLFRLAPLGLGLLALGALRLLGFALLRVELLLLGARLTFEHIALDVGALAPHFDVDGAGASLIAGQLQLALGLALESDAARGRALTTVSVAAAQMRQQLELGLFADHVLGARYADASLVELCDQT